MLNVNSSKAGYLFDTRKANAHLDIGDKTFMCGRKVDAIKFWALWRYRGRNGISDRVNMHVDNLKRFADKVRQSEERRTAGAKRQQKQHTAYPHN